MSKHDDVIDLLRMALDDRDDGIDGSPLRSVRVAMRHIRPRYGKTKMIAHVDDTYQTIKVIGTEREKL